jgi:hypothetical protein
MRIKSVLRTSLATIILLAALWWRASSAWGQTNDGPKILFLHLKVQQDKTLKLVNSITRPGELKPPANTDIADGIHYELLDAAGKSLWHAVVADPSRRIVEHADPANATKLRQFHVELPEAEFMVRVPVRTNAVQVEFYRLITTATNRPPEKIRLGAVPMLLK